MHVCYAPEFESLDDVRQKLNERKCIVSLKCKKYGSFSGFSYGRITFIRFVFKTIFISCLESIKFGTVEYEAKKPFFENKIRNKQISKKKPTEENPKMNATDKTKKTTIAPYSLPQLPDNWVKETLTGSSSYDQTVTEISSQLKRTLVK